MTVGRQVTGETFRRQVTGKEVKRWEEVAGPHLAWPAPAPWLETMEAVVAWLGPPWGQVRCQVVRWQVVR